MRKAILFLVGTLAVPAASWAADTMRDGLWEITSTMEMPGMSMKVPPSVVKHCYSKSEAQDTKKVIAREKDCKVTDMKNIGNKVTWTMVCTGKSAGTMTGETVFGKDSYSTVMHMKTQGHAMTMKAKAKRLGDCK